MTIQNLNSIEKDDLLNEDLSVLDMGNTEYALPVNEVPVIPTQGKFNKKVKPEAVTPVAETKLASAPAPAPAPAPKSMFGNIGKFVLVALGITVVVMIIKNN